MRKIVMSAVVLMVVLAWSGMARAQVVNGNAAVNANANMQFHDGHWWYWHPENSHWMVYRNNQWFAPNASGQYMHPNGQSIWAQPYSSGYRGNFYGNNGYGNAYGNGYYNGYGNGYYGNGYGNGYGNYGYGNRGANVGANIGGALGGQGGANVGAAVGGLLGGRR